MYIALHAENNVDPLEGSMQRKPQYTMVTQLHSRRICGKMHNFVEFEPKNPLRAPPNVCAHAITRNVV